MGSQISAGILLFRRRDAVLEVLLANPGGPYWSRQQFASWSVPKGIAEDGETLEAVAAREFAEETGFQVGQVAADPTRPPLDLGEVILKSGKVGRAWAVEGELDPTLAFRTSSEIEWPPRSGRMLVIPGGRRGGLVRRRGGAAAGPPRAGGVRRAARARAGFVTPIRRLTRAEA